MIEELRRAVRIQRRNEQREQATGGDAKIASESTGPACHDVVFHHLCVGERLRECKQRFSELNSREEKAQGPIPDRTGATAPPPPHSSSSSASSPSLRVNVSGSGGKGKDSSDRHHNRIAGLAREQHLLALELHDLTCSTCRRCAEKSASARVALAHGSASSKSKRRTTSSEEEGAVTASKTSLFDKLRREQSAGGVPLSLAILRQSLLVTLTCARSSASNITVPDLLQVRQTRTVRNGDACQNGALNTEVGKRFDVKNASPRVYAQEAANRWMAACAAVSPLQRILFAERSSRIADAPPHSKKESGAAEAPATVAARIPNSSSTLAAAESRENTLNERGRTYENASAPKADGPSFKIRIGGFSGSKRVRSPSFDAESHAVPNRTASTNARILEPIVVSRTNSCVDVDEDDSSSEENAVDVSTTSSSSHPQVSTLPSAPTASSSAASASNEFSGSPWSIARQRSGNLKTVSFSAPRGKAAQSQSGSSGSDGVVNDDETANIFSNPLRDASEIGTGWSSSRNGIENAASRRLPQPQPQPQQHQSTLSDFFCGGRNCSEAPRRVATDAPPENSAASRLARAISNQNVEEMFGSNDSAKPVIGVPPRQTSEHFGGAGPSKPLAPSFSSSTETNTNIQKTDPTAASRSFVERLNAQQSDARRYFTEKSRGPSSGPANPSALSCAPRSNINYGGADSEPPPQAPPPPRGFVSAGEQLQDDIKSGKLPTSFLARSGPPPSMGLRRTGFNPPFANNNNNNNNNNGSAGATAAAPPQAGPPARSGASGKQRSGRDNDDDGDGEGKYPESLLLPDGSVPPILIPLDAKLVTQVALEIMESNTPNVGWEDIAGLQHAKSSVEEAIVWPLRRPDLFVGLRDPPRGLLLFGPPGTGKTMIARAIASRANCTFLNISSSSLMSKWLGDGEKLVRCLFAVATVKQPSVIFIDELDSLLSMRGEGEMDSVRRVKTEFLVQLDGVATDRNDRVLLIGATNRPDELDEAARRRLEKRLYIPLPDVHARRDIIHRLLSQLQEKTDEVQGRQTSSDNPGQGDANQSRSPNSVHSLDESQIYRVGELTEGYSGADLKHVCREAAMGPLREVTRHLRDVEVNDLRPINMKDFAQALRRIKPSVGQDEVKRYVTWNAQFGSFPVEDEDVEGRASSLNSGDDSSTGMSRH